LVLLRYEVIEHYDLNTLSYLRDTHDGLHRYHIIEIVSSVQVLIFRLLHISHVYTQFVSYPLSLFCHSSVVLLYVDPEEVVLVLALSLIVQMELIPIHHVRISEEISYYSRLTASSLSTDDSVREVLRYIRVQVRSLTLG